MGSPGLAAEQSKRPQWAWREWFHHYRTCGVFPDEFGRGLVGLLNSLRRSYPDSSYGPWDKDRIQELLCRVLNAIVRSRSFVEHYEAGWNNQQLYGYIRRTMASEIVRMRQETYPAWFWMLDRLTTLAGKKLYLIDKSNQLYVPAIWIQSGKQWDRVDDESLEARLSDTPFLRDTLPKHIPESVIQQIIDSLFETAGAPIPLEKLALHCLRILRINDLRHEPIGIVTEVEKDGERFEKAIADEKTADPTIKVDVEWWLGNALCRLTVEHLLVLKFRTCDELTLEETAQKVRDKLGLEGFCLQTASNRYSEAVRLMGSVLWSKYNPGPLPGTEEARIFGQLLSDSIAERLRRMGVSLASK